MAAYTGNHLYKFRGIKLTLKNLIIVELNALAYYDKSSSGVAYSFN